MVTTQTHTRTNAAVNAFSFLFEQEQQQLSAILPAYVSGCRTEPERIASPKKYISFFFFYLCVFVCVPSYACEFKMRLLLYLASAQQQNTHTDQSNININPTECMPKKKRRFLIWGVLFVSIREQQQQVGPLSNIVVLHKLFLGRARGGPLPPH